MTGHITFFTCESINFDKLALRKEILVIQHVINKGHYRIVGFIFKCWSRKRSEVNKWEVLSRREDKIRDSKRSCNAPFIIFKIDKIAMLVSSHCENKVNILFTVHIEDIIATSNRYYQDEKIKFLCLNDHVMFYSTLCVWCFGDGIFSDVYGIKIDETAIMTTTYSFSEWVSI